METELGCDLIIKDPSHRTAELTLQGDIFQSHVEDVLLQIKTAVNEVHQSLNPMMTVGFSADYLQLYFDGIAGAK